MQVRKRRGQILQRNFCHKMAKAILVSFSIYRVSHMDLSTLQPNLKLKTEPNHISYHKNDGINWLTLYNMSHPYETPCIMSKIKKDTYSLCITTFLLDLFLFMSKKKFFAELVICSPKLNIIFVRSIPIVKLVVHTSTICTLL